MDEGLAGIMVGLWEFCDTSSSCQDHAGRAYVVPTAETADAAERFLTSLGLTVEREDGVLFFRLPAPRPAPEPLPWQPAASSDDTSGDQLSVLHRLQQRVAGAAADLAAATVGVDHARIAGARTNLELAGRQLVAGMRRIASPVRRPNRDLRLPSLLSQGLAVLLACTLATTVAGALTDRSVLWTVVAALAGYGLVSWPMIRLTRVIDDRLSRWRLARALAGAPVRQSARDPGPSRMLALICTELLHIQREVDVTRRELGALTHERLQWHPKRPPDSPAGLAWAVQRDSVAAALVEADLSLATASDDIRVWLSLPRG